MARISKTGINYFSFDVDFFTDDKLQLIESEFGMKGGYIAVRLLCKIYKESYYYQWGADECLLFTKTLGAEGVTKGLVDEVINGLVRRCFFDKKCYDQFGILTSRGIQIRYLEATKRYKEVQMIEEYILVDNMISDNVYIVSINVDTERQIKGKEIKRKESKYTFDDFWDGYDKKVGRKDKIASKWGKLNEATQQLILNYLPRYKESTPDKKFRKNPETFLNNESWNDEIITKSLPLRIAIANHSNSDVYEQF